MPKVHKTCIYSKKSKVLIVKRHQTCIYSKKIKNIKNLRLYVGLTGIDELVFVFVDFFEYMQVWWLFTIKTFDFIEYMQVLCAFGINMLIFFEYMQVLSFSLSKCLFFWVYAGLRDLRVTKPAYTQKKIKIPSFSYQNVFFEYMQVWGTWGSPNLHILKKNQHFDAKSAQNLHILKKIKSFDSEKAPNLHILKKNKKHQKSQTLCGTDWHRWIGFWFFCFFWVYAGLVTFHYQNFWFYWVYAGFVRFWHQNVELFWVYAGFGLFPIKMFVFLSICRYFLIFLSICRFGAFSLSKLLFFLSICRFCALLASKCLFFLSICRFGEPQVFQTYIFATKKKRRIDTLDMFFLLHNFPDGKEIHKMFKYNELFSTTLSMIFDTFKRGIKHKELLDRHCKAHCRDPDITLKTIKKNIGYVTVSPHTNHLCKLSSESNFLS